jgi:hypothetical protein
MLWRTPRLRPSEDSAVQEDDEEEEDSVVGEEHSAWSSRSCRRRGAVQGAALEVGLHPQD